MDNAKVIVLCAGCGATYSGGEGATRGDVMSHALQQGWRDVDTGGMWFHACSAPCEKIGAARIMEREDLAALQEAYLSVSAETQRRFVAQLRPEQRARVLAVFERLQGQ